MAKKKRIKDTLNANPLAENVHIEGAGNIKDEKIVDTLVTNYMPYAMSVILSRAIPEIDGFKPSHRKLLYTMYNMGLLQSGTIKSANIVGRTMQLNPHGDASIYETMIRLSRGNESLLYPYVESTTIIQLNSRLSCRLHFRRYCAMLQQVLQSVWRPQLLHSILKKFATRQSR